MAIKYKKISPCIWNDAKVNRLSVRGKLAFVYMLTHPQQTSVGAIRTTPQSLACEIPDLPLEAFKEAFAEGLAEASPEAPLITFPNFLKYNHPESPNVANSWGKSFLDLPECLLRDRLYDTVIQELTAKGSSYVEGFEKGLGKGFRYSVPLSEAEAEAEAETKTFIDFPPTYNSTTTREGWTCECGEKNKPYMDFCIICGVMK